MENKIDATCNAHGEVRNAYKILVAKLGGDGRIILNSFF
jgi:hypothetical protein